MPIKHYQELRAKPDLNKETSSIQCSELLGTVTHMRGWRKTMEDADILEFNIDENGTHLFAVFDGHGGGQIAIFAKRHLKDLLLKNQWYKKEDYERALQQLFPKLDAMMMTEKGSEEVFEIKEQIDDILRKQYKFEWQDNSEDELQCLAGSTAIVCLMTKETIFIASVGDSRCMISTNHQCKNLAIDHKPDLPDEKRRIEAAGGRVKNHRVNGLLGMSRSLGDFQFKTKKNRSRQQQMVICDPHIEKIVNKNIEFILLGCDGIWEGYNDDWYFNHVHEQMDKKQVPSKIVEHILDNVVAKSLEGDDGHDNMTAILILSKMGNNNQP